MEIAGQLDLLDLLPEIAPATHPVFKVHPSGWHGKQKCGWCGSTNVIGGGACRHPQNRELSIGYDYCKKCVAIYGHPHINGGTPIILMTSDEQRIFCPFCRANWGHDLKPQVLARITQDHAPTDDGRCLDMATKGVTEPYYAPKDTPWLSGWVCQFPRPKGYGGLYQLKGAAS